jgi:hypothetical protein
MKISKMATINPTLPTVPQYSVPSGVNNTLYPVPYMSAFFLFAIAIAIAYFIESSADSANISDNWSEVRCKPHNMLFAGMYGHDVAENFQYCIQQIVTDSTKTTAAPFAQGMGGFTTVLTNLMNSANSIRVTLATMVGGIIKIVSEFKSRMTALMGRVKLTASRMKAMMFRVYGTMFAVMYMGISAQTGIANFGDTFIFKFIDAFCFAPDTKVIKYDKTIANIQDLELGDKLYNGSIVEAIIECPVPEGPLYEIYGIKVSGIHKIWSPIKNCFIPVKEHPDAKVSDKVVTTLWTLNTSNREIPVRGVNREEYVRFADWEEMSPSLESSVDWNKIAYKMLNKLEPPTEPTHILEGPCLERNVLVYKFQGGLVPISTVQINDWIYDIDGWTRVKGLCIRLANSGFGSIGNRITEGNWILNKENIWVHPKGNLLSDKWKGYQLITDSGSFMIDINLNKYIVRDFTEVGCENLVKSYEEEDAVRCPR